MKNRLMIIIVVAVTLIIVFYMINQNNKRDAQARLMEQQVAMINASTAQQTACQESWVCATTSLLTGAGDVLGGLF